MVQKDISINAIQLLSGPNYKKKSSTKEIFKRDYMKILKPTHWYIFETTVPELEPFPFSIIFLQNTLKTI